VAAWTAWIWRSACILKSSMRFGSFVLLIMMPPDQPWIRACRTEMTTSMLNTTCTGAGVNIGGTKTATITNGGTVVNAMKIATTRTDANFDEASQFLQDTRRPPVCAGSGFKTGLPVSSRFRQIAETPVRRRFVMAGV
jgi:hypothetical protein